MKSAPDRIVPLGLAARMIMAGFACGSLALRGQFWKGAAVGGLTAIAASYPGWRARMAAMEDHGQTPTGLVEDALVVGSAVAILAAALIVIDRGFLAEQTGTDAGFAAYVHLAWLASSLGMFAGAVGSSADSYDDVLRATYGHRERLRRRASSPDAADQE